MYTRSLMAVRPVAGSMAKSALAAVSISGARSRVVPLSWTTDTMPLASVASTLAAAPGLLLLLIACVWSERARLADVPTVLVVDTLRPVAATFAVIACVWSERARLADVPTVLVVDALRSTAATFAVIACVWLPDALLPVDALNVPGVVSATSSALTVRPRPAPTANVRLVVRSPPPVRPAPAVSVTAERAIVESILCVWLPDALLPVDALNVPGVVSATSSALTVRPRPAPTESTPPSQVSPPPAAPIGTAVGAGALSVMPLMLVERTAARLSMRRCGVCFGMCSPTARRPAR